MQLQVLHVGQGEMQEDDGDLAACMQEMRGPQGKMQVARDRDWDQRSEGEGEGQAERDASGDDVAVGRQEEEEEENSEGGRCWQQSRGGVQPFWDRDWKGPPGGPEPVGRSGGGTEWGGVQDDGGTQDRRQGEQQGRHSPNVGCISRRETYSQTLRKWKRSKVGTILTIPN